jgi:putative phosphoribosyl transferase
MNQQLHAEPSDEARLGPSRLRYRFDVPARARGMVLFAHGSGSGLDSPRNRYVAEVMQQQRLATLLVNLLHAGEEAAFTFDVGFLGARLLETLQWLRERADRPGRGRVAMFGASTGAAAALWVAAEQPSWVEAVVSRGGRPDLAAVRLPRVRAPTLLVVGGLDTEVLALNRAALAALGGEKRLEVVPGATHLFSEPGTLDAVAQLSAAWVASHLDGAGPR